MSDSLSKSDLRYMRNDINGAVMEFMDSLIEVCDRYQDAGHREPLVKFDPPRLADVVSSVATLYHRPSQQSIHSLRSIIRLYQKYLTDDQRAVEKTP